MGIDTEIYQIHLRKNIPDILAQLVNFKEFAVLLYSASLISSEALEKSQNVYLQEYDRKFEVFTYLKKTLTCDKYRKIIDILVESENELCANILKEALNNDPENESEWVKKFGGMVIGIDLGTTYSCVGGYIEKEDRVEMYPDECGRRLIPSIVAFCDSGRILVGHEARDQMEINRENTIFNVKRIIGRVWDDPVVQNFRKTVPYQIINEDGWPKIRIKTAKCERNYSPEEISAIILTKMKEIAELNLNQKVEIAIITAPAYFNDAQRNATKDAGEMTGLTILKIINEPTAAALAYNLEPSQKISERAILVYDLGGGTFDVSVLDIGGEDEEKLGEDFAFVVEVTSGLTYLGGEDFNNKIIDYFAQFCQDKYHKDIREFPRSMQKLQIEVEKAKRSLSESLSTKIKIENFLDNNETFNEILTREKFEELNKDLFERTISILKMVVSDAKSKKSVDKFAEIVLVGGSTRIPKIQELVRNCFENGEEIITGFCPDEAIAYGAALYARILAVGHKKVGFLLEITPLSLGVEAIGGRFTCIVPKNTAIPIKYSKIFSTSKDYQTEVEVNVYEGEEKLASDNNLLGTFYLTGITPAKWGIPQIKVTLQVDSNGFLQVSAKEKQTGNKNKIKIMTSRGNSGGNSSENSKNSKISKFSKEEMEMRNELNLLIFQKRFQLSKSYIEDEDKLSEFEKIIKESETVLNLATDGDEILRMANYWQQILKLENIFNEYNEANILGDGR